jgi:hypothetical protein
MKTSLFSVLALLGLLLGALQAEIDPRRKEAQGDPGDKKEADGGKKRMGADDHEAIHRKLAEEGEANLKEIAKLMEKIRNDLSQKQTGDRTQADQKEVVKKIDELIEKAGKGCQSCSGSSGSEKDQKEKQSKKNQQAGSEKQRQENEQQNTKPGQEKQSAQKNEPKQDGKVPNDRRREGALPPSKGGNLADPSSNSELWGRLPKRVVEQMRNSTGKDYPPEYRELISRYYRKMSELYQENAPEAPPEK